DYFRIFNHCIDDSLCRQGQSGLNVCVLAADESRKTSRHRFDARAKDGSAASVDRDRKIVDRNISKTGKRVADFSLDRMVRINVVFSGFTQIARKGEHTGMLARTVVVNRRWV